MKIKARLVPEEGLHLEGEDSPKVMEFSEPLFEFKEPIHYSLDITWVGKRGLFVSGSLSTTVRAKCVRTLEWFDLPLQVEDFEQHVKDFDGDEVDLTPLMREDILLLLPANPVSPEAEPLKETQPTRPKGGSLAWGKLDELKIKPKK
jgi:uncharacterized metal-binding protein YceD (DUF177 family)